ncbi:MAG: prepilin-type N-terminal cleavage/methylation domain-containing protein [Kiritimatiellae bacterium]|nr:prepilin-type N-terminal cleavage/methylation domain-containing protein [Kiritimatiellia bacterium]
MRKGFTILELLVASLLLGMLVSILTMIFNQSSIAWRTGVAGVADLDKVRDNVAEVREEADNIFLHDNGAYRLTSLWQKDGSLRSRACSAGNPNGSDKIVLLTQVNGNTRGTDMTTVPVGAGNSGNNVKSYTVGVTSWGPDGEADTYDDITTWPDEIDL